MMEATGSSDPNVSVVIAAYNAAAFIARAIGSVQSQTLQDFEIIVVDDVSTDDTVQVVSDLAKADPRIRLIRSERNGGPSAARNRGFSAARGTWIAVLDADDAYKPDRLAVLTGIAKAESLDMLADDIVYYDLEARTEAGRGGANDTGGFLPVDLDRFLRASLFRPAAFDLSGRTVLQHALLKFVFRRSFVEAAKLRYPEHLRDSEDFFFYAQCLIAGARAGIAPSAGYLYTQRVGSVSRKRSGQTRTLVDRGQVVAGVDELLSRHGSSLTRSQVRLLRERQAQARGLGTLEAALDLAHERRMGSALRLLASVPPSWGFVSQVLVQRARRAAPGRR